MTDRLGNSISLDQIKEFVRSRTSLELTASAKQVNLNSPETKSYVEMTGPVPFPPLLNRQEIFRSLWLIDASKDSLKWDYITLLTYLNEGEIFYESLENDNYLVTIKF